MPEDLTPHRSPAGFVRCPDDGTCHHGCAIGGECWRVRGAGPLSGVYPNDQWPDEVKEANGYDRFEVMSDESSKPVTTYLEAPSEDRLLTDYPDDELPGMWERADFEGGETDRMKEKRERFMENYGIGKEGVQRFLNVGAPSAFDIWWGSYWKNKTDTFEHTIARGIARDAWDQGRKSRG